MASSKHLDLLVQGVVAWNRWRHLYPSTRPDLSGLLMSDLESLSSGPDDSYDVWLKEIDLSGASLAGADLQDINLAYSDLTGADLTAATLSGVCLNGAILKGVRLIRASLKRVELSSTDLSSVELGDTLLAGLDMSNAKGVADVVHAYSSIVDVSTLDRTLHGLGDAERNLEWSLTMQSFFSNCGVRSMYLKEFESGLDV